MFNAYAIIDDLMDKGWCLESAEAVLKLCSLRSSGDVETYWRFHITTGVSTQPSSHAMRRRSPCPLRCHTY